MAHSSVAAYGHPGVPPPVPRVCRRRRILLPACGADDTLAETPVVDIAPYLLDPADPDRGDYDVDVPDDA